MGTLLNATLRWRGDQRKAEMAEESDLIFCSLVKSTLLMSRRLKKIDFFKINSGAKINNGSSSGGDERTLPETLGLLFTSMFDFLLDRFGAETKSTTTVQGKLRLENVLDDWLPLLMVGSEMSVLENWDLDTPVHPITDTITEVSENSIYEQLKMLTAAAGTQNFEMRIEGFSKEGGGNDTLSSSSKRIWGEPRSTLRRIKALLL